MKYRLKKNTPFCKKGTISITWAEVETIEEAIEDSRMFVTELIDILFNKQQNESI